MQTIVWEVECLSCVKVRRHCHKCGEKTEFVSSGRFRVNANKKRLDVWLVYRCAHCGTTWNLPVHDRTTPARLPQGRLEGFAQNDAALAEACAMDTALLERHGCQTQPPDYNVTGPGLPMGQPVRLVLHSALPINLRVDKLLRQKLGLSAKELDDLLRDGSIKRPNGGDVRRLRLSCKVELDVYLKAPAHEKGGAG